MQPLPAVSASASVVEAAPSWGDRAYHLESGIWELTGKLSGGRGAFSIAYHDGSTRPAAMRLESATSCTLSDRRTIVAVHIVGEDPRQLFGESWYGIYTGSPPKKLGALVTNDEIACTNGKVFLMAGACRRGVTITDKIAVDTQAWCPGPT